MSHAPIPARFYPAGGDAHGHPALVELVGDVLQVLPEDSLPRQVPLAGLQAATRGFNHSQWAIAWAAEGGGQHMLLIDEAAVGPLRAVAPALFAGGEGARRRSSRRFLVGIALLALVPLVMVAMNVVYALAAYPFGKLSDRVHHFMTVNELRCFTDLSYMTGGKAPGLTLRTDKGLSVTSPVAGTVANSVWPLSGPVKRSHVRVAPLHLATPG